MNSLILKTGARLIAPLMLAFSVFILLRGHDAPGGGFIGGLIAATAFALYAKAEDTKAARRAMVVDPITLSLIGLGIAALAGLWGWIAEGAFLTSVWPFLEDKTLKPVASTLFFDIGVYVVVVGSISALFLALEEDVERHPTPPRDETEG